MSLQYHINVTILFRKFATLVTLKVLSGTPLLHLTSPFPWIRSESDRNSRLAESRSREAEEARESGQVELKVLRHRHRQEADASRAEANRARQEILALQEEVQDFVILVIFRYM